MSPETSTADKIRRIVSEPNWTEESIAGDIGVSKSTVVRWLKGTEPGEVNRNKIDDLYKKVWAESEANQVPLVGYVGAGHEINQSMIGGEDMVKGPPQPRSTTVAVRVLGNHMLPAYDDGWLLYYSQQLPAEEMVHYRCVVKTDDGRLFVKTIRRGTQDGLWTLVGDGATDIADVELEWVAPIDWVRPRVPERYLEES